jgi:hypothetical protein
MTQPPTRAVRFVGRHFIFGLVAATEWTEQTEDGRHIPASVSKEELDEVWALRRALLRTAQ